MSPSLTLDLVATVDHLRSEASKKASQSHKANLGQFLTPAPIARLMAGMFKEHVPQVRLLDPGAGIGTLTAAFVQECCAWPDRPVSIEATLYEIDESLREFLFQSIETCEAYCRLHGISFTAQVEFRDFISAAREGISEGLFAAGVHVPAYNYAILNPPYRKIAVDSPERAELRSMGIETSNLYAGFVASVVQLLENSGQFVAITPRSFCNGSYFQSFRKFLVQEVAIRRLHVFESRNTAFRDDRVLQENIILAAVKKGVQEGILVTASDDADDNIRLEHEVPLEEIVQSSDPQRVIHIPTKPAHRSLSAEFRKLTHNAKQLGIEVSTGPVVDFRLKEYLRAVPSDGAVPLLYPAHFANGSIAWPRESRKPNAIEVNDMTGPWLIPNLPYVLTKRFTSKEETRRIVAVVYDGGLPFERIGLENHVNYYHRSARPLEADFAHGLAAFLNSTLVDEYFRQFNGHTQVNASDLRSLRYPSRGQLVRLGQSWRPGATQQETDNLIAEVLAECNMTGKPVEVLTRIREAEEILRSLGLPKEQQNERSALTLLALLELPPTAPWSKAKNPLIGITPIMDFIRQHYGHAYAPNTRETIRRQTVHQMVAAGLLVENPDKPGRPTNSPGWVYQVTGAALALLQSFGTANWGELLEAYLKEVGTLARKYAQERAMMKIPIEIAPGKTVELSPGGQNALVDLIWHEFSPRFTPGGRLVYLGDTDEKFAYFDKEHLASLGVVVDSHGKMPDVIIHFTKVNWLVLVEAVTSHGPISPKRRAELRTIFAKSTAGLVFVTAFMDKRIFTKFVSEISWQTEVWVADSPSHLIHFDGERFLGPYAD